MSDSTKCPRCESDLPANFPPGICPTCLLQQGLSPNTYLSGTSSVGGSGTSGRRRSWTPPSPAELAPRFPQLEIIELLGQGGMGAVYKVRQRELDRWAALKILPDEVAHDPSFAERFQREARALALLGHQHIVTVYEFGQRDGVYFLLMEYIDGVTLRQAIRAGQISAKDALAIVTQICDALQFAHEEGVVHRDIKPENILIDKRGRVKIADFGLAKLLGNSPDVPNLTGTHQVMGTPMYMAPEQMEGTRGVDHRADIFSLGVVFYELLTGELPLGRFAPPSQKYQLDVRLDDVVLRTLEKEPDRRYQQASDVKCDVESIRSQPRVAPLSDAKKPRRTWAAAMRQVMMVIGFLATAVATLMIISFLASMPAEMANHQRMLEQQAAVKQYEASVARFQAEKQVQQAKEEAKATAIQQLEAATLDPFEAEAIVQFTDQGPKLNAQFGTDQLTTENRAIVNQILARIHSKYLEIEARHRTISSTDGGLPATVVIEKFDDDIVKLENDLWTEIDSKLPVAQQKFLRDTLPVYASESTPILLISPRLNENGTGPSGSMMGSVAPQNIAMPPGMGMPGMGTSYNPSNLRYPQLLGWEAGSLPIRFWIGRRGKWFRWTIATTKFDQNYQPYLRDVDTWEAPALPSGLLRLWREITTNETRTTLSDRTDAAAEKDKNLETPLNSDLPSNEPAAPQLAPAENLERLEIAPEATDHPPGAVINDPNESEEHVINSQGTETSDLDAYSIPDALIESAKPLFDPGQVSSITLEKELKDLDRLGWGEQSHWDEIERRIISLIASVTKPEHRGQIHSHAAVIYAKNDIQGHGAEATFHAKEAIKFERDSIKRASMFMSLGVATTLHNDKSKTWLIRREEATRWYLKGYAELLAFQLPDIAPQVPVVEETSNPLQGTTKGEIDAEQIAAEVRYATQMRQRQEAEFTGKLVQCRDNYVRALSGIYGRFQKEHVNDPDAKEQFEIIATEVLGDPKVVIKLMNLIWRKTPVEPEKSQT